MGELHCRGIQQCLPHVHLLHRQREVQRECPSLGGKKCSSSSKFRLIVIALVTEFYFLNGVCQVFKKEPSHFPFFFKCVMEAVLAGDEAGLTLKEQTVLLVFLDHCFNSLVCTTTLIFICNLGNVMSVGLLLVGSTRMFVFM